MRQRGGQKDKKGSSPQPRSTSHNGDIDKIIKDSNLPKAVTSDWDYKLAFTIITALAFVTRFWGIGHPDEVVFDEVHFGKVRAPLPRSIPARELLA